MLGYSTQQTLRISSSRGRKLLRRNFMVQQRVPQGLQRLLQQAQESTASTEALHKLQSKL
jgi:hypothetical protein